VNQLCGANQEMIVNAWRSIELAPGVFQQNLYGDGTSATRIVDVMMIYFNQVDAD